ncbi:hypothetical protein RYA05_01995 [Pseudomonas syringae pv. actinidiae]|nr:hypothetical protein [Pseudomonas syringae pv. actinidiae]
MDFKWLLLFGWVILFVAFMASLFAPRISKLTTQSLGIGVVVGFMAILLLIGDLQTRTENVNWHSYCGWLCPDTMEKGDQK